MFTGLVREKGNLIRLENLGAGKALFVALPGIAQTVKLGDSIAINGACLTAVEINNEIIRFELSPETLAKTTLGSLQAGQALNAEPSLKVGDDLGGHFVQGHVDGVGELISKSLDGGWETYRFRFPDQFSPFIAPKGAISVDGVSLTVVDAAHDTFTVALIPHTLNFTNLGEMTPGTKVNLETDMLARYLSRMLAVQSPTIKG